jgi:2-methylcitrate dehydratase PrpD
VAGEIERLAQFAAVTRWQDVPERVQHHTKLVLLDTLGVMLAGSERPEARALTARLAGSASIGATVLARGWPVTDSRTAAPLNGIAGRSIELCEGLPRVRSGGDAGAPGGPGGRRAGAVLWTRNPDGVHPRLRNRRPFLRGIHAPTSCTPERAGIASGSGRCWSALAGAGFGGISRAMRIATTMLLTPSYTNAIAGATTLNVAGGMSGFAAALAPELALAGFEAQDNAIEEALGSPVGSGFHAEGLLEELGNRWEITQNYFRLHACCNPIHPALDCLQELITKLRPRPEEIDRIEVATYRFASLMRNPEPQNFFASKYSLPHAAAAMIVNGNAGHASLNDAALQDPVISSLRIRVHVTEDPAMTEVAPRLRPARVTMKLKDGRSATLACESHCGDFNKPFAEAEIREKFRELAGAVLTAEEAAAVELTADRCEQWRSMEELTMLLRCHAFLRRVGCQKPVCVPGGRRKRCDTRRGTLMGRQSSGRNKGRASEVRGSRSAAQLVENQQMDEVVIKSYSLFDIILRNPLQNRRALIWLSSCT